MHILYILNKTTITTENRSTVLHNLFLLDMPIFNKFATNNDPVEKATSFSAFMEGMQHPHDQLLVLEDKETTKEQSIPVK